MILVMDGHLSWHLHGKIPLMPKNHSIALRESYWELCVLHLMATPTQWSFLSTVHQCQWWIGYHNNLQLAIFPFTKHSKNNILIINGDMNALKDKDKNNKLHLLSSPNRNG